MCRRNGVDDSAPLHTIDEIQLPDGRCLTIRAASSDDADGVMGLYQEMSVADTRLRFFTASLPPADWFEQWTSISERGGFSIVAVLTDDVDAAANATVVGEAGYSLLPDGDGELAVAVAQPWRGWLGPYLLDVLVQHAGAIGIQNLQADVLLENRPMLNLLIHRGAVTRERQGGETRLSIATVGHVPTWPPNDRRRRLLVEVEGGRWNGAPLIDGTDLQLAICSGPARRRGGCPELCDGTCPLVEGADAVAVLLDDDDPSTSSLLARHRERHPDMPVFIRHRSDASVATDHELPTHPAAAVAEIASIVHGDREAR